MLVHALLTGNAAVVQTRRSEQNSAIHRRFVCWHLPTRTPRATHVQNRRYQRAQGVFAKGNWHRNVKVSIFLNRNASKRSFALMKSLRVLHSTRYALVIHCRRSFELAHFLKCDSIATVATAFRSQSLFTKFGMQTLYQLAYSEYSKNGDIVFKVCSVSLGIENALRRVV